MQFMEAGIRHLEAVLCNRCPLSTVQIQFQTIVGGDIWAINVGDLTVLSQQFVVTVPGVVAIFVVI